MEKAVDTSLIKANAPKKSEIRIIRILITCALCNMMLFVIWFAKPEHIGYAPIYWILTFALSFKLIKMLHEWYHYWSLSVPVMPVWKKQWTVDVLTTACPGEPKEMIIRTLKAMVAIKYPHTNYLCDEGDDPELKAVCKELGVVHVTRVEKINAKAGNINNALKQATGEICVVLDPDHLPIPEFLHRVLPYFEDPSIGYVQCVQGYYNQNESIIARGAAEQTYHFYGPMMMCMNSYGTVQAIGANCTFRRKALDSIGGHAAGLSEDMHTAMRIHANGWKSIYVPEMLSKGLVPGTLSGYYKQQLKWSRGTFELLFEVYPKLFKNFTWRQKIHYATLPLYFLYGLVNLIDIVVPLMALGLAEVPWEVDVKQFAMYYVPLCSLSMTIRLYAQRWLLEKHERGFHLAGGILRTATWWIFLVGFVYSIFRIKVPYIPTPKEDEHQNYWKLSFPNLIIAILSATGILYGLSIDWTPYSIAMASYSLINCTMLGFVVIMSQQKLLETISARLQRISAVNFISQVIANSFIAVQTLLYSAVRKGPVAILAGILLLSFTYGKMNTPKESTTKSLESGGFYLGIEETEEADQRSILDLSRRINSGFELVSVSEVWDSNGEELKATLKNISSLNALPLIRWETGLTSKENFFQSISNGKFDSYLEHFASVMRQHADPVLLNFIPEFDNPKSKWFRDGNNSCEEFTKAWQYIYIFFNRHGVSNVTWIWNPLYNFSPIYYPGNEFVDYVGIPVLNHSSNSSDGNWVSFTDRYLSYREQLQSFNKPIIITEFGSANGLQQSTWFKSALKDISEKFSEIASVVLFNSIKEINLTYTNGDQTYVGLSDFSFSGDSTFSVLRNSLQLPGFAKRPFSANHFSLATKKATGTERKKSIINSEGKFHLNADGNPFYIRGVAYNTSHDWRDGNIPLTRRQLEKDFSKIKEMGANTIRRYDPGFYDKNILNLAKEFDLKVLYGFWFDPKIDFYKDSAKIKEYISRVEETVIAYKDHPAVLAWSLGNEAWGLLKHSYSKPYLIKVRQSYVNLVEYLAQRIHEIDPGRAVFTCMEHREFQIEGEIAAFHDGAPSIDAIGVNSYYKEQISQLDAIATEFDPDRPYLVSEFGPRGYWLDHFNRKMNNSLVEDNEAEKAEWYKIQWKNYVEANKGKNLGGVAYCWHDRMEGSQTWFGLTDYKGRPKPSYFALKAQWTKVPEVKLPLFTIQAPRSVVPGKEYIFEAVSSGYTKHALTYEWHLLKSEMMKEVDNVAYESNDTRAKVKIPEERSKYRLYLYVSDKKGNVTTASIPLEVK
jgi:cellulose synthase (UDP-forming)